MSVAGFGVYGWNAIVMCDGTRMRCVVNVWLMSRSRRHYHKEWQEVLSVTLKSVQAVKEKITSDLVQVDCSGLVAPATGDF